MRRGNPLFVDITWHPAGDPAADKEIQILIEINRYSHNNSLPL